MPRFLMGKEVWEITQRGSSLAIGTGKSRAKRLAETVRKFVSGAAATEVMEKLIAAKIIEGYVPVAEPTPVPTPIVLEVAPTTVRSIELEQAIAADPYHPGVYAVYGDWLQGKGDPRGELIALMTSSAKHDEEIAALMKTHRKVLFGDLIGRTVPPPDKPPLIWKYGFIHRLELERERHGKDIAPELERILTHPSGQLATEVVLRSDDLADLRVALEMLVRHAPASLRLLEIVSRTEIGEIAQALAACPRLTRLTVKLRSSRRVANVGLAPSTVRAIVALCPPTIERLEVRCGNGSAGFGDVAPLFLRTDLSRLTHLRIRDARFGDALLDAVLAAPFAAQLVVLDLGMCEISDAAAERFIAGSARLAALAELWVSQACVSRPAVAQLERGVRRVVDLPCEPVDATLAEIYRARYSRGSE